MDSQSTSSKEDGNHIKKQRFDAKNQFNKGKFDQSTLNMNEKDAYNYYNTASGTIVHKTLVFPNITNMQSSLSGSAHPQHRGTVTDSRRSQQIGEKFQIKIWNFEINARGKSAIIAAAGGTFTLYSIVSQSFSMISALCNTFAPLATELVNNLAPGSITVQVLTKGDEVIKSLLQDYFSGKIAREVKEIFEGALKKERCKIKSVTLKEVGVVMADKEVFDDIKREAEHTLSQLSTSQDSFKNEITFSKMSSIIDDKSRVITEKVSPTATEKDVIDQTRNLELCLQTRTMGMASALHDTEVTDQEAQTKFSRLLEYFDCAEFKTSIGREDFCGRGGFASVRKCFHVKLGHVAVKCFEVVGSKKRLKQILEEVRKEANSLIHLSHKNIVRIHGLTVWNNCIGIVMNFVDGGNLDDFLLLDKTRKVSWPLRLRINVEITEGLSYLHHHDSRRSFVHGDLKPQNILLTSEVVVKIADFGAVHIAKSTGSTETSFRFDPTNQLTEKFAAPELLNDPKLKRKPSLDVYSYSSIGAVILTRKKLFDGFAINVVQNFLKKGLKENGKDLEEVEEELSKSPEDLRIFHVLKETMERCGEFEPQNRPDIRQVCYKLRNKFGQLSRRQLKNLSKEKYECEERGETEQVPLSRFASPFMESSAGMLLMQEALLPPINIPRKQLNLPHVEAFTSDVIDESEVDVAVKKDTVAEELGFLFPQYNMEQQERGCFMIFNHKNFKRDRGRKGTTKDAAAMEAIAKQLGFQFVRVFDDLKKPEILQWIEAVSKADHSMYDCFACAILTHGGDNNILHAYDDTIELNEFVNPFNARNCPSLAGKPKLFFIQASRGFNLDKGAESGDAEKLEPEDVSEKSFTMDDILDKMTIKSQYSIMATSKDVTKIPIESDYLIAHSTTPGYYSWRNENNGSIFVQSLARVVKAYGNTMEITEMMTLVNRFVAREFESSAKESEFNEKKQMPSFASQLTAKLYFPVK